MPSRKQNSLFLETTEVSAQTTLGEITGLLVQFKASSIETIYEGGKPIGLSWSMVLYDTPVYFRLPAKVDPVYRFLRKRISGYIDAAREQKMREQAERVAWRNLLAWLKVQMAMIQIGMVEYAQVFLPYMQESKGGVTAWDAMREQRFKQIEAPKQ